MVAHDGYWPWKGGEYREDENMTHKDVDDSGPLHQDRDWPRMVDNCDQLLSNTTLDGALIYIVKKDEPDMKTLKYLLECAPQVKGDVLECAVTIGNQEIVSLLLINKGADPNHFSRSDVYTGFILGIAVKGGRMDIMKLLLDKGADIKEGFILGIAVKDGRMDIMKLLLDKGADIKEGKDGKHSKNHPDDAKSQTDLLVEKKYLDPPDLVPDITVSDAGSPQRGTDVCSVQKHSSFGRLKLFDVIKGDRKLTISLETPEKYEFIVKKLLKQLCDTEIHESKEGPTHKLMREWKETPEWIRHLREFSLETTNQNHVHVYMVPDVMSRISSYQVWPHRNIRTGPLVEAGFTCKDPNNTTVECKSCGLELIASTLNGTNPTQYHREKSPKCEFFNQTNSQSRHGNIALTDQAPSPRGANQEAAHSLVQQSPGNNQQNKSSQAQAEKTSTANDASAQARHGSNDGNISIDDATATTNRQLTGNASSLFSNNGAASFDSIVSERPRTEEVSDRTGVTVPNNNNMTLGGEAVRENENIIPGAQGGEIPYPIRNPRFTEQHARRETFTHWPHRAAHDIVNLVIAGFFYTGAEDIVRCFYCDIGLAEWTQDDDPWVEHARHSPECPYLRDQKGQDFINNIQTQWARIYTPKHPEYSQINVRRRSYENAGWPRDNVLQTPEQLAAAGFFYTGDGDTVQCHYCDGGLREWEPADDPWVEHARWFPFCKFVVKIKGIDFIQAAATRNTASEEPLLEPAVLLSYVENIPPFGSTDLTEDKEAINLRDYHRLGKLYPYQNR